MIWYEVHNLYEDVHSFVAWISNMQKVYMVKVCGISKIDIYSSRMVGEMLKLKVHQGIGHWQW
jgi:hypothetical protein